MSQAHLTSSKSQLKLTYNAITPSTKYIEIRYRSCARILPLLHLSLLGCGPKRP